MPQGKLNEYRCQGCAHVMLTIDRDEGTTPFMTSCPKCCIGIAQSSFYRVPDPGAMPTHEWYRPDEPEYAKLNPTSKQHVSMGGLLLREITTDTVMQVLKRKRDELTPAQLEAEKKILVNALAEERAVTDLREEQARKETQRRLDLMAGMPKPGEDCFSPAKWDTSQGQFSVAVRENEVLVGEQVLDDPFIRTEIHVSGWRNALRVLLNRYRLEVRVRGATPAAYRAVMTADYSYTPDPSRDQVSHDDCACKLPPQWDQLPPRKERMQWLRRMLGTSSSGARPQ